MSGTAALGKEQVSAEAQNLEARARPRQSLTGLPATHIQTSPEQLRKTSKPSQVTQPAVHLAREGAIWPKESPTWEMKHLGPVSVLRGSLSKSFPFFGPPSTHGQNKGGWMG